MMVPEQINLRLITDAGQDLAAIVVELTLRTGRRNPRHIYFPKSDHLGRASLDRDDFLGQFNDATEADLMGSWGTIEQAFSTVEVSLYNPAPALAAGKSNWPLFPHERTRWSSRAAEYAYRTSCRNLLFIAEPLHVDLHETSYIRFTITPGTRGAC
jgi:hypothetical protein